ncbi:hypothetical protein D3C84_969560 [compost metagenome]
MEIYADVITQDFLEPARRGLAAFAVEFSHALDMASEMPLGYKRRDDGLGQFRAATEEYLTDVFEALDLRFRHHQIREADPRKQHLAERAAIEYPTIAVQAFECRQRAADVAVLAVVVVFDNPGVLP